MRIPNYFAALITVLTLGGGCLLSLEANAMRDPTRPENVPEQPAGQLHPWGLQAIIISNHERVAIFDGRPLYVGSPLAGFKVVKIKANTVHLEGPDGKMTLFLFNRSIKKSAKGSA